MTTRSESFAATVREHVPGLPLYLLVPTVAVQRLAQSTTFIVDVSINGETIGRRSIKPWGKGSKRWFMELTKAHCQRLEIGKGSSLDISISLAAETPEILIRALRDAGLEAAWENLRPAERRQFAEPIFEAKQDKTKLRRVEGVLERLRSWV